MPTQTEKAVPTAGTTQHTEGSTQPTWGHDTTTATAQPHAAPGTGQISPKGYKAKNHSSKGTPSQRLQTKKARLNSVELSLLHTFLFRLPPPLRARDFVRVLGERASVPLRGSQASIQLVTPVKL